MFEASLIESAKHKGSAQRWYTLPLSVIIHVVVIGTSVGARWLMRRGRKDPPRGSAVSDAEDEVVDAAAVSSRVSPARTVASPPSPPRPPGGKARKLF